MKRSTSLDETVYKAPLKDKIYEYVWRNICPLAMIGTSLLILDVIYHVDQDLPEAKPVVVAGLALAAVLFFGGMIWIDVKRVLARLDTFELEDGST